MDAKVNGNEPRQVAVFFPHVCNPTESAASLCAQFEVVRRMVFQFFNLSDFSFDFLVLQQKIQMRANRFDKPSSMGNAPAIEQLAGRSGRRVLPALLELRLEAIPVPAPIAQFIRV